MQERGRVELKRAKRSGAPVSVILCDLDHFKNINDRYGHEAGDAALVQAARVLREALRESDALGRWGGEEFIAVLPATGRATAPLEVAERMRIAIERTRLPGLGRGHDDQPRRRHPHADRRSGCSMGPAGQGSRPTPVSRQARRPQSRRVRHPLVVDTVVFVDTLH